MSDGYSIEFARFFFEFRRTIGEDFAQLFETTGSETTEGVSMQSKWGWYNVLYSLANDNILNINKITELGIREVLTYLAYRQDDSNKKRIQITKK